MPFHTLILPLHPIRFLFPYNIFPTLKVIKISSEYYKRNYLEKAILLVHLICSFRIFLLLGRFVRDVKDICNALRSERRSSDEQIEDFDDGSLALKFI
jgi:hypothetical protein